MQVGRTYCMHVLYCMHAEIHNNNIEKISNMIKIIIKTLNTSEKATKKKLYKKKIRKIGFDTGGAALRKHKRKMQKKDL